MDGDIESYKEPLLERMSKFGLMVIPESRGLEDDLKSTEWWMKNFVIDISRKGVGTPDQIKYKGDKTGTWVFDWTDFIAVNKNSGDTVRTTFHDEYLVSPENKIVKWFTYYDTESFYSQIQNSFGAHRNGIVYDEHPHIETLKGNWLRPMRQEMQIKWQHFSLRC